MTKNLSRTALRALAFAAVAAVAFSSVPAVAEEPAIRIASSDVTSEFPEGFRIKVRADAEAEVSFIAVRVKIGQQRRGAYDYLCQDRPSEECEATADGIVEGEMLWRTNTGARYVPPGTVITYNFEVEDANGNFLETEQEEFIYHDARFEWEEVSEGPIAVAYHGPVAARAELIRDAMIDTLNVMGPILGADTTTPIRVTMYNNTREMLQALPPGSTTIRRELVTEGQAFSEVGTLLVLGGGRMAAGTASHEVTHILVHRGGTSVFRGIPSWLNEGLAEFGNVDPGYSYEIALEFAVATKRLLPVMFMETLPGDPEDVIIFYGQARSIIRFMIDEFGASRMTELMAELQGGTNMDDAMLGVYGHDRLSMDTLWRQSIGAEPYVPPDTEKVRPTPIPGRTLGLFTLTPQAQGETVASKAEQPAPTPTAEPPTPTPTPTPAPSPVAAAAPDASGSDDGAEGQGTASSGGCSASLGGGSPLDPMSGAMLLGLAALAFRRRLRR